MKGIRQLATLLPLVMVSVIARAEGDWESGHNHEAHVHGVARLTLAVESDRLQIELESPAANLVGFEHQARTTEELHLVEQAESLLAEPDKLFTFSKSSCELERVLVDSEGVKKSGDDHHGHEDDHHDGHHGRKDDHHDDDLHGHRDDHHEDEHHGHKDDHHDDHHRAHKDDHHDDNHHAHHDEDHHEVEVSHSEISANYLFHCHKMSKLDSVSVTIFDVFPGVEQIEVQWVTTTQQGGSTLNKKERTFYLR